VRRKNFGAEFARHAHLSEAPSLTIGPSTSRQMMVTRLRSENALPAPTLPFSSEPAYFVSLQLRDNPDHQLWLDGKRAYKGAYGENTTSVVDLRQKPVCLPGSAFDYLVFYIKQPSLDDIANEHDGHGAGELRGPRGVEDPTLATLGRLLIPALEGRADPNSLFVQHVGLAIHIHLASAYAGVEAPRLVTKGGLAPWQERRAKECMRQNYAASLSISDIARECGLSPSHFTRAFRQSTGMQPHRWLTLHRVETAKERMLDGKMSLAEISLACGFGDQNNFTRVFSANVGVSPGHWQRINR